jgi:hypothetical protein
MRLCTRVALETMVRLRKVKALVWGAPAAVRDTAEKTDGEAAEQAGFAARSRRRVFERLEAMGLGWTLMALARKRVSTV